MLHPLHGVTNLEQYLCNQSSCYTESMGQMVLLSTALALDVSFIASSGVQQETHSHYNVNWQCTSNLH